MVRTYLRVTSQLVEIDRDYIVDFEYYPIGLNADAGGFSCNKFWKNSKRYATASMQG